MKVVVDTNSVFSAILNSQRWIGQVLLRYDKRINRKIMKINTCLRHYTADRSGTRFLS